MREKKNGSSGFYKQDWTERLAEFSVGRPLCNKRIDL